MHVFGCPVYVLDPKLQDGKKLPKWSPRCRRGQYLRPSPNHSTMIGCILNLRTGHVLPQYHCVYDNQFSTVSDAVVGNFLTDDAIQLDVWEQLVEAGCKRITGVAVLFFELPRTHIYFDVILGQSQW